MPISSAPRRLRLACDACAISKVRCDKKHPSCTRCRQSLFTCSYSPSRRHGKQSWAKYNAGLEPQHEPHDDRNANVPSQNRPSSPQPQGEPCPVLRALAGSTPEQRHQRSLDDTNMNFDLNLMDDLGITEGGLEASTIDSFGQRYDLPMNISTQTPTIISQSNFGTASMSLQHLPTLHDCEAKALAALHSLHYCHMYHSSSPGILDPISNHTNLTQDLNRSLPIDKILLFNRVALTTMLSLLNCSCTQQAHVALMYFAIISKSVSWYRLITSSRNQYICPTANANKPEISGTPAATASLRSVTAATIHIGSFDLEDDDQISLMRDILTRMVKKLEPTSAPTTSRMQGRS
ncbi:unnamed protein product [Periconia digitata]|uniref:Zn(2)-C6 fungal-type domain-containing protein n=1 Tax=Periconia digitata TaxID=1303443 RepID=A0A9W4XN08_9PLEO|nr:unnamed protein product [Periconia digitata]